MPDPVDPPVDESFIDDIVSTSAFKETPTTSHGISCPVNTSGDTVIMLFMYEGNGVTVTPPAGWTLRGSRTISNGSDNTYINVYSNNSGPSGTLTVTTSASVSSISYAFKSGVGNYVSISTGTSNSVRPNPDAPSAFDNNGNFYQIAVGYMYGSSASFSGYPTGYGLINNNINAVSPTTPYMSAAIAAKQVSAVETPSEFNNTTNDTSGAFTIVIADEALPVEEEIDIVLETPIDLPNNDYYPLNFIKDLWWNNHSSITNASGDPSTNNNRICDSLDENSKFVSFKSTNSGFYFMPDNPPLSPEDIFISTRASGGYTNDFSLEVSINNTKVATHNYSSLDTPVSGYYVEKSSYFKPNSSQKRDLMQHYYRNPRRTAQIDFNDNFITLKTFSSGGGEDLNLYTLKVAYSGYGLQNSYSALTPEVISLYPSKVDGNNFLNSSGTSSYLHEYITGPTNSSGVDVTYISGMIENHTNLSGISFSSNYNLISFDPSGYFDQPNNTRKIDKCIFSMRYDNQSGDTTNNQSFVPVRLMRNYDQNFYEQIGFGSGFHIHNTSGYERVETEINFFRGQNLSDFYGSSDLLNKNFGVRLEEIPTGVKFSSAQLDFYLSNDDVFPLHTKSAVSHKRGTQNLNSDDSFRSFGGNRLIQSGYSEQLFDDIYQPLDPGSSLDLQSSSNFWKSYYDEKIDTDEFHNHAYKNSLYLSGPNYITEQFNSSNPFGLMLHVSTSGNFDYLNSEGMLLSKVDFVGNPEFTLYCNAGNQQFVFVAYDSYGGAVSRTFPSYSHNMLLITKSASFPTNLQIHNSDTNSDFQKVVDINIDLKSSQNNLYIGGVPSVGGFSGFIHEYGITTNSNNFLEDFDRSRNKLSSVLANGDPLILDINSSGTSTQRVNFIYKNPSGEHPTLVEFDSPQSFAYNTWITNTNAYSVNLDYELISGVPSGVSISGYFKDYGYNNGNIETGTFAFNGILPSGTNNYSIPLIEFNPIYSRIADRTSTVPVVDFYINTLESGIYDLKINNISIDFDGWYSLSVKEDLVEMHTRGFFLQDDSLEFYIDNNSTFSGFDLITYGHSPVDKSFNYFVQGQEANSSGLDFYLNGQFSEFNNFNLYQKVPEAIEVDYPPLYIAGKDFVTDSGNFNFYINSTTVPETFKTQFFYTIAEIDDTNSINLYMGSSEEENEDSLNLFVGADIIEYTNQFDMFVRNIQGSAIYDLEFSIQGAYDEVGSFNIFTAVNNLNLIPLEPINGNSLSIQFLNAPLEGSFTANTLEPFYLTDLVFNFEESFTYQWKKDGINLNNTSNISGVNTHVLTINIFSVSDKGTYSLDVTNTITNETITYEKVV